MTTQDIPSRYICPITLEVFKDPVVDKDGNSYEREAIENWLRTNSLSPITRRPLNASDLVPNRALKDIIESFGYTTPAPVPQTTQNVTETTQTTTEPREDAVVTVMTHNNDALIRIKPLSLTKRTPVSIAAVIDISGSMGEEAKFKNERGAIESDGLSILDIVKHAVLTMIATMTTEDSLSLITFSDTAEIVLPLTTMTEQGKTRAKQVLGTLEATNSTNIWAGLEKGMDVLREGATKLPALFLFTDGVPNIEPPRGHMPMLRLYKDKHNGLPCIINTFGFGYNLESKLLNDLAFEGNGSYVFIPDSSFVGTAFINATANLYSIMATKVQLSVEAINGAKITNVPGGVLHKDSSWGSLVDLGTLQLEQAKDVVVQVENMPSHGTPCFFIRLTYDNQPGNQKSSIEGEFGNQDGPEENIEIVAQQLRVEMIDTVIELWQSIDGTPDAKKLEPLLEKLKKYASKDKRIAALLEDVKGQVSEAMKPNYFKKWGRHYLPSLMTAHRLQICNNFKDPGVQVYGGQLFEKLRDEFDEIFRKLPPPKPSDKPRYTGGGWTYPAHVVQQQQQSRMGSSYSAPQPVRSIDMNAYHNSRNVCFDGSCVVAMADGLTKKVNQIKKGDQVKTSQGQASVVCVVETVQETGKANLVKLDGGLLVTEYHPIQVKGQWVFPNQVGEAKELDCDKVYSFVLDAEHVMNINGYPCVTLGHNFVGDVREHAFFGSSLVIENLRQLQGWNEGVVSIGDVTRDPETGMIIGLTSRM
jgi:Mg-chelatase subunit ChlD